MVGKYYSLNLTDVFQFLYIDVRQVTHGFILLILYWVIQITDAEMNERLAGHLVE